MKFLRLSSFLDWLVALATNSVVLELAPLRGDIYWPVRTDLSRGEVAGSFDGVCIPLFIKISFYFKLLLIVAKKPLFNEQRCEESRVFGLNISSTRFHDFSSDLFFLRLA